ncbi:hypothetical protein F383_29396 [Gossypium arboreum]|uniref:Uncharacterized protein n=1 Tax=Gossypium arboreum TaxID=29729 RepID=A0A0B0N0Q5_GOSAR|nr:hypothetical protein F383_29396 [Gossypium arboreum]
MSIVHMKHFYRN